MPQIDFDPMTAPWIDRADFPQQLEACLAAQQLTPEEAEQLRGFARDGYLHLEAALEPAAIDRLLAEVEAGWRDRPAIDVLVEGKGSLAWAEVPPRGELAHHHFRLLDFQDVSPAARELMLHPRISRSLELIFGEPPAAMQSLYFEYGSEQHCHQDYPYVQAKILSHLVGCWIACEDVGLDNGPLFYYRGSHRIPKFRFGTGELHWDGQTHGEVDVFEVYVEEECRRQGLERLVFQARKGDVLFWHAALVHGGSPAITRSATRRSLVAHYSTRTAYPRDRRWPHEVPKLMQRNGGTIYLRATPGPLARLRAITAGALRRLRGG